MLDNTLIFSLILSVINTLAFFLIKNNNETVIDPTKRNQELLMLFGITFICSFLLKSYISGDLKGGGDTILTHTTRAPF